MRGMARLRRIVANGWVGGEWARAGWVDMLFSARMDGIGPLFVAAEFFCNAQSRAVRVIVLPHK